MIELGLKFTVILNFPDCFKGNLMTCDFGCLHIPLRKIVQCRLTMQGLVEQ